MTMTAREINDLVKDAGYGYVGIRVDNDVAYSIGDDVAASRVWDVYGATDEMLDGTSCIGLDGSNAEQALRIIGQYRGNRIYIIAGHDMDYGEDVGEIIIRDAVIIAVVE